MKDGKEATVKKHGRKSNTKELGEKSASKALLTPSFQQTVSFHVTNESGKAEAVTIFFPDHLTFDHFGSIWHIRGLLYPDALAGAADPAMLTLAEDLVQQGQLTDGPDGQRREGARSLRAEQPDSKVDGGVCVW
ncbi:hypothetical protein RQP46_008086 [Phenoliferia psychrophenolica]